MVIKLSAFLVFVCLLGATSSTYYDDQPHLEYMRSDSHARDYYHPFYDRSIEFARRLTESDQLNPQCRSGLSRLIAGIENNEFWALKFFESSGLTIQGKLIGQVANFGAFEHCVGFRGADSERVHFDGQYCLVSVQTPESNAVRATEGYKKYQSQLSDRSRRLVDFNLGNAQGFCVPSSCKIEELTPVVNRFLQPYNLSILPSRRCTTASDPEPWTNLEIAAFLILALFVLLCTLSLFIKTPFLANFSLVDNYNAANIYNPKLKLYFDGLKFFVLMCGIITHSMVLLGVLYSQPFAPIKESEFSGVFNAFIGRFIKAVDVLFFYSGFFTIYAWHDLIKSGKLKYDFHTVFYTKYVRYAIVIAIMILITFLLPKIGSGPRYSDYVNHMVENCKENYWKNFLLISNVMSQQRMLDMCIMPSWHLSSEFQCYTFHAVAVYYLIMKPKLGFLLLFVQFICVSAFNVFYVEHYAISTWESVTNIKIHNLSDFEDGYFLSIYYFNIYSLGLVCAWLAKNNVKPKIIEYRWVRILILSLIAANSIFAFYLPESYDRANQTPGKWLRIIWPFYFKFSVCSFYFWVFYSFSLGYSRPFRALMSLKWFIPWSRMSLSISLIQFIYLHYSLASTRTIFVFNRLFVLKEIVSTFVFTWIFGNLMFLFLEQPLNNLFRNYLGTKRRQEVSSEDKKSS